jgi:HK97 family phage prohead protease
MQTRSERATLKRETRLFQVTTHLRADGEAGLTLDGYACVTGVSYEVNDWLGTYEETVEPGAFTKTLAERDDVRLLLNHEGLPLARTKSGTMRLNEDGTGLHVLADLDKRSTLTNDVAVAMERGDLDQMSFAFQVTRQEWNEDYTRRSVREVKTFDTSVVTFPASATTSAKIRGIDFIDALDDDELREMLARGQRRLTPTIPSADADADALLRMRAALYL